MESVMQRIYLTVIIYWDQNVLVLIIGTLYAVWVTNVFEVW